MFKLKKFVESSSYIYPTISENRVIFNLVMENIFVCNFQKCNQKFVQDLTSICTGLKSQFLAFTDTTMYGSWNIFLVGYVYF